METDHVTTRSRLIKLPNREGPPFFDLSIHVWLLKSDWHLDEKILVIWPQGSYGKPICVCGGIQSINNYLWPLTSMIIRYQRFTTVSVFRQPFSMIEEDFLKLEVKKA
jgi:hypothetical protein